MRPVAAGRGRTTWARSGVRRQRACLRVSVHRLYQERQHYCAVPVTSVNSVVRPGTSRRLPPSRRGAPHSQGHGTTLPPPVSDFVPGPACWMALSPTGLRGTAPPHLQQVGERHQPHRAATHTLWQPDRRLLHPHLAERGGQQEECDRELRGARWVSRAQRAAPRRTPPRSGRAWKRLIPARREAVAEHDVERVPPGEQVVAWEPACS